MAVVMIGVDPRKAAHAAVAAGADEAVPGRLRVRASAVRAGRLLERAAAWPQRAWAVEGAGGPGRLQDQQPAGRGAGAGRAAEAGRAGAAGCGRGGEQQRPGRCRPGGRSALRSGTVREVVPDDHPAVVTVRSKRHRPGPGPPPDRGPAALGAAGSSRAASARRSPRRTPPGSWRRSSRLMPRGRPAGNRPPACSRTCGGLLSGCAR